MNDVQPITERTPFDPDQLPENRSELSDEEYEQVARDAHGLVGKVIRDEEGRLWRVKDWDPVGKDGWATIDNDIYWTRPDDAQVVDAEEAARFATAVEGHRGALNEHERGQLEESGWAHEAVTRMTDDQVRLAYEAEGDRNHGKLAVIVNEQVIELSEGAYRVLCGLVQPTDVIDPFDVTGPDAAWEQLRRVFPVADASTIDTE